MIPVSAAEGRATSTLTQPAEQTITAHRARRRRPRSDVPWAVAAILATPIAWYLAGSLTLFQNGFLDPYFYTGYVNRYGALLERYGNTYYATRIAYIFPERILSGVFGSEGGYYAWHYLLAIAALGAVYATARRLQGVQTAIIVTAFLVACPWLPRALVWDYVDGAAITFVLIGMYFLLGSGARMQVRWAAAGVAFSLAINCNFFVGAIIGMFGISWLCFGFRSRSVRRRLVALCWLGGAMAAVQLALATFMAIAYPTAGFFYLDKSFDISSTLLQRNDPATYASPGEVLRLSPWVAVPALGLLAAVAFAIASRSSKLPAERRALVNLAALFSAGCGGLYLVLEVAHQAVPHLAFYVDYLIPAFVLSLVVVLGELLRMVSLRTQWVIACVAASGLLVAYLALQNWTVGGRSIGKPLLALGVCTLLGVVAFRFAPKLALGVLLVMIVVTPFAFLVRDNAEYLTIASGRGQTAEWDIYRAAHIFQDTVLDSVPADRRVAFWYGPDASLTSVQSMLLYNYSKIFDTSDEMPTVTPTLLANISRFDYLVLLGLTPQSVEAGTRALCAAGQNLHKVGRRTVRGDVVDLTFVIFRRDGSGGCTGTRAAA